MTPGSENLYPVDVEVVNPGLRAVVLDNAFVYVAPPVERITAINPPTGLQRGGEAVIIKGVDFVEGMVVSFFGRPATDVVVLDASTLRVITPAGPPGAGERERAQPRRASPTRSRTGSGTSTSPPGW